MRAISGFGAVTAASLVLGLASCASSQVGAASASAFLQRFWLWFLALSIVLLGIGFWQQRRARLCSLKRSYLSAVLLWTAIVLVGGMIVFPQQIAGFIADHLSAAAK